MTQSQIQNYISTPRCHIRFYFHFFFVVGCVKYKGNYYQGYPSRARPRPTFCMGQSAFGILYGGLFTLNSILEMCGVHVKLVCSTKMQYEEVIQDALFFSHSLSRSSRELRLSTSHLPSFLFHGCIVSTSIQYILNVHY